MKIPLEAKILVCVGTGGVGKTTLAAALGALAAEEGRRTLVLTIDPAKRLKTTLGLPDDGTIRDIPHPRFKARLAAAVLNPQRTFDEFVIRAAGTPERAQKILNNKLYIQMSTTLNGSQEFTALERLTAAVDMREFDLIILDTPPSQHAMDFLRAPRKLTELFQEGISKWLRDPEKSGGGLFAGLFQMGTKQVLKALELLTGADFMHELTDFFSAIQGWQDRLKARAERVHRLLVEPSTHFYLVSSYDRAKLAEARRFGDDIREQGSRLKALLLNRSLPTWWQGPDEKFEGPAAHLAEQWRDFFERRRQQTATFGDLKQQGVDVHEIPELGEDIRDLDGVLGLVDVLKEIE